VASYIVLFQAIYLALVRKYQDEIQTALENGGEYEEVSFAEMMRNMEMLVSEDSDEVGRFKLVKWRCYQSNNLRSETSL
jgi:hypothetical protein